MCSEPLSLNSDRPSGGEPASETLDNPVLLCRCGLVFPIAGGVPRLLPTQVTSGLSMRTLRAFGEEWRRFPELHDVHGRIFDWYFAGPEPVEWKGLRVLDAGCGMGRWLHFAVKAGAEIVGMDVSPAVDVAAVREGDGADFVQADLRFPPFAPGSFDLVYSLGVVHHLEDPKAGVRALAGLVRPGGELRLYVYRSVDDEPLPRRFLLALVTAMRVITTRAPYPAVHVVAWLMAAIATPLFLWPRRLFRRWPSGDRLTCGLPLVHYADVPFRMLVSEQFDRLVAPIEGRFRKQDVEGWLKAVGFEVVALLPGLGWRAIARRPLSNRVPSDPHVK
jgi:SAM-dependent methyltransferase